MSELLDKIQASANAEYLKFLGENPESRSVGDYVLLYGQDDLEERNTTYELPTYLPDWFTLGDDGGGYAMLMRLDGSPGVYQCGHGAIGSLDPEPVAESFAAWLADECPLVRDEDDDDYSDDEDDYDDD